MSRRTIEIDRETRYWCCCFPSTQVTSVVMPKSDSKESVEPKVCYLNYENILACEDELKEISQFDKSHSPDHDDNQRKTRDTALWTQIQAFPSKGENREAKEALQTVMQNAILVIISNHNYPTAIQNTLNVKINLDADYLICDIEQVVAGKNRKPIYKVTQNPERPQKNLIIIVSGSSNALLPSTTHFAEAHKLLKKLYSHGEVRTGVQLYVDTDRENISRAEKAGLTILCPEAKDPTQHWKEIEKIFSSNPKLSAKKIDSFTETTSTDDKAAKKPAVKPQEGLKQPLLADAGPDSQTTLTYSS